MLVTPQEVLESNNNKQPFQMKAVPVKDSPVIEILSPKLDGPVASPTAIQLKFTPKGNASVKPETFKAYYGTFQIDITNKLLSVTKVTPQGIDVKEAALPKGDHKITLNIEDSEGRMGSRVIAFEIK
jgi:hypothetical protein